MKIFVPALLLLISPWAALAVADPPNQCRVVDVDFLPADKLQIVAWLEDPAGHYVETIFITQQTGTYGIGNRPGRLDFNSGPNWPYGRRETVFPVWAHRHGVTFPKLEFQDEQDTDLSHAVMQSSMELHFCRPLMDGGQDKVQWDAGTCATPPFTDKGHFSATGVSLYPPRVDIARDATRDSMDVEMFTMLNTFDAVSQATPPGGMAAQISWPIPGDLPEGAYVMFVEVSQEFDDNDTYNATSYPSPANIPYGDYGDPYRGQPSVVYSVPFMINETEVIADTQSYAGYGDPDGQDGMLRAPDATITTDTPGSGASRLQLVSDGTAMYRLRVDSHAESDLIAPGAPEAITLVSTDARSATLSFIAPGDDGNVGKVRGYEARVLTGADITDANFESATLISTTIAPEDPGQPQQFVIDNLLPQTSYSIGIRALDNWIDSAGVCHSTGPLSVYSFATPEAPVGSVDACFIATAAYGSLMANDVGLLRQFRDVVLRNSVLGELAVEGYYTFGPAIAGMIGESDLLRATTRDLLAPIVERVKAMKR